MSDSEADMPPLVYSSDETEDGPIPKAKKKSAKVPVKKKDPAYLKTSVESASLWSSFSKEEKTKQEHVIKVYTLAPFLFGQVKQPDGWIEYIVDAGLLKDDQAGVIKPYLTEDEAQTIDFMEKATTIVIDSMKTGVALKPMMDFMDKLGGKNTWKEVLAEGQKNSFIEKWRATLKGAKTKGVMALLFSVRQYVEHMVSFTRKSDDYAETYKGKCDEEGEQIEKSKKEGNTEFTNKNYKKAVTIYNNAIYRSPYNHILYSNRAQAYLKDISLKKRCVMVEGRFYSSLIGQRAITVLLKPILSWES
jgi:hypothetical protein